MEFGLLSDLISFWKAYVSFLFFIFNNFFFLPSEVKGYQPREGVDKSRNWQLTCVRHD